MIHDPKKHRIYLAGPMRGIPEFNFPTFRAVAWALRLQGYEVFNPAEKDEETYGTDISNAAGSEEQAKREHGFDIRRALRADLDYICDHATIVALLPGWEMSSGSMAEHRTAVALRSAGMEVAYLTDDEVAAMRRAYDLEHGPTSKASVAAHFAGEK